MSLIKSISGVRGTIGGEAGKALTPTDVVDIVSSYAQRLRSKGKKPCVMIGRDARISGEAIQTLAIGALRMAGVDVIDLGFSTTPTVAYMVCVSDNVSGGIIITASHNPREWNALKLLNEKGEFISEEDGQEIYAQITEHRLHFPSVDELGNYSKDEEAIEKHIQAVLDYPLVDVDRIKQRRFRVVADVINSTGAIALPILFDKLGVEYILIHQNMNGNFAHNPEPLPDHLVDLGEAVKRHRADLGIAVDPDVDRLCFVCEDGEMFGEEYTLVAVADYVLRYRKGDTVSNLSSSKALMDISAKHGVRHFASKVGEAHVVSKMREVSAVIGGEGNGGVIVPDFHYGRDALIGIGLFLSFLAEQQVSIAQLRSNYPFYTMVKDKITLKEGAIDKVSLFEQIKKNYSDYSINEDDGLKMTRKDGLWVQLRTSNTEPIIRIFSESEREEDCKYEIDHIKKIIHQFL